MLENSVLDRSALENTTWLLVISISHATFILESLDLKSLWVLEKREDINGHLISEIEWCVATPKRNESVVICLTNSGSLVDQEK